MSFLKKFGKGKSSTDADVSKEDGMVAVEKKDLKRGKRGSASFNEVKTRDTAKTGSGDVQEDDSEDFRNSAEKDKERRKYKDMSRLLVGGAQESRAYPTFSVHYLGRIPTSSEYGREAVEEPVNQLCKLREKQKLQRVYLNFNVEGLYCREVSGPFLKTKKDGINMHIPFHHITYGVVCAAHPTVFACIAKMNEDPSPENQVLVLHGFVCDKPETTQAITYWQLQAYIEAYEYLKCKRILRARRKQAFNNNSPDGSSSKDKHLNEVPEKGAVRSFQQKARRRHSSADVAARAKQNPKEALRDISKSRHTPLQTTEHHRSPPPSNVIQADVHHRGESRRTDHHRSAASTHQIQDPNLKRSGSASQRPSSSHQGQRPSSHQGQRQSEHPPHHEHNLVRRTVSSKTHADSSGRKDPRPDRAESVASISSVASSSSSNGDVSTDSPLESPGVHKEGTKTFEHRIGELERLVNMDAEKLKKLMIEDHPTLARYAFYFCFKSKFLN